MSEFGRDKRWRKEFMKLSDEDLCDELSRPTGDWKEDVIRESLIRLIRRKQ